VCVSLFSLQPEDSNSSGSGTKNEANRTSGGSGGLMEEMNALLARRSEHRVRNTRAGIPIQSIELETLEQAFLFRA
jgi:hypothetical protein